LFVCVMPGDGINLIKNFIKLGLDKKNIKIIGTSYLEYDILNDKENVDLNVIISHNYSASLDTVVNKNFVEAFKKANQGLLPTSMAVSGYDGMRIIDEAVKATNGNLEREKLFNAMKNVNKFLSPRGPMSIDSNTRDVVQNMYIHKLEKINGKLSNTLIDTISNVKSLLA